MIEIDMGGLTGMPKPAATVSSGPLDIPLDDIAIEPQPRTEFNEELINTIAKQLVDKTIGQIEPIYVCPNPAGIPPWLLVHGETRYRACQKAKLKSIRAEITTQGGFIRQLLSNETRGDLTLLDKAHAYRELIDHHGFDQKSVARLLGTDATNISRYLALLNMHELVERAHREGRATSLRVLDELRKLVILHPKSLDIIEKFVSSTESISVGQIADLSKRLSKKKPKSKTKLAPRIGGKEFSVVSVEDDVLTVKIKGVESPKKYRLVPIEQPE